MSTPGTPLRGGDTAPTLPPTLPVTVSREDTRMRAKIINTQTSKDSDKDKLHVNYILQCSIGPQSNPYLTWHVSRRYRLFEQLHTALVGKYKDKYGIPPFPQKRFQLKRTLTDEYIQQRSTALQEYLTQLLLDADLSVCAEVSHFLVDNLPALITANINSLKQHTARPSIITQQPLFTSSPVASSLSFVRTPSLSSMPTAHSDDVARLQQQIEQLRADMHKQQLQFEAVIANTQREHVAELEKVRVDEEKKFGELLALTKEIKGEKKTLLKLVKEQDATIKKLKQDRKVLKECVRSLVPEMLRETSEDVGGDLQQRMEGVALSSEQSPAASTASTPTLNPSTPLRTSFSGSLLQDGSSK